MIDTVSAKVEMINVELPSASASATLCDESQTVFGLDKVPSLALTSTMSSMFHNTSSTAGRNAD